VGHLQREESKGEGEWLEALERGLNSEFPEGVVRGNGLHLMSDNGNQLTSLGFMRACKCAWSTSGIYELKQTKGEC